MRGRMIGRHNSAAEFIDAIGTATNFCENSKPRRPGSQNKNPRMTAGVLLA
jgi:hypothetical protein